MIGIPVTVPRLGFPITSGLQAFFYAPGTTTKQNTYTTSALSVTNSNPMVADANGLFAAIYLDPALGYKIVVAPSTDTDPPTSAIFTQDNFYLPTMRLPQVLSKVAADSPYTVTSADGFDVLILCDCTAGAITVAPYTAIGNTGKKITVIKTDSSANAVTIDPSGSQTWGPSTTRTLSRQYDVSTGESDNANWRELTKPTAGRNVLQMVTATYATETTNNTSTYADTGLTASITPAATTSVILALVFVNGCFKETGNTWLSVRLLRGVTVVAQVESESGFTSTVTANYFGTVGGVYLDSPASVAALTYKATFASGNNTAVVGVQNASAVSSLVLLELAP